MALEETHLIGYPHFYLIVLDVVYVVVLPQTLLTYLAVQCTMLGPLLSVVYINDITDYVSSSCRLFADNCILYRQINSVTDATILQNDLTELKNWEKVWKMKFKMYGINSHLEKHPLLFKYYLHYHKLTTVTNVK